MARLSRRATKGAIEFDITKGRVLAYYGGGYYKGKKPFILTTDEISAQALGTDFMVDAMPESQKTWLGVLDGVVKVTSLDAPGGVDTESATVYVESRYKTEVTAGGVPSNPST